MPRCSPSRSKAGLIIALGVMTAAAGACSSSETVATGPSPAKCQLALAVPQSTLGPAGGQGTVTVTVGSECAWTAASEVSWITAVSPTAGQGSGEVRFQVLPNPTEVQRQGALLFNTTRAHISQSGLACAITVASETQTVASVGDSGTIDVTAADGCQWTAISTVAWLTITAGSSGVGNGVVQFSAAANSGSSRTGTIDVAGQTVTVTQNAQGCTYAISPTTQSLSFAGGAGTPIAVTAPAGCGWTSTSSDSWISVSGGASGTGNGTVSLSVAANTGAARSGTVSIGGVVHTVTQGAATSPSCTYSISPTAQSLSFAGGTGTPIAVTAPAGCAWTSMSNDPWISVSGGASGTGNGTVTLNVAANTGAARSGSVLIGGQVHTVTQSAVASPVCAYSISPTSQTLDASKHANVQVAVTAGTGCAWTATSSVSWITVTLGASGSGSGTVEFSVEHLTGNQSRTGTLTIAGQTFTVNQIK